MAHMGASSDCHGFPLYP